MHQLSKQSKAERTTLKGITLSDFKLYYRATGVKLYWVSTKQVCTPTKQKKCRKINPNSNGYFTFDKCQRYTLEKTVYLTNCAC